MKRLRPTWLEIELQKIDNNVRLLKNMLAPSCILMSVVKANAYGHGAVPVARTALAAGASRLAVATLSEATELRKAGIAAPILILGYTPPELVLEAVHHNISLTIYDLQLARAINQICSTIGSTATVHVKVDTGMNRLGVRYQNTSEFLARLSSFQLLNVEGLYTHFATADEEDKDFAITQLNRFSSLVERLVKLELRPPIVHAANSAGLLNFPQAHFDMVRSGIAQYGLHPDPISCRLPSSFQPALQWKAKIAQVRDIMPGESVSYGREFVAKRPMTIAVIPVGYADGFPRKPLHWQHVLVSGKCAKLVGRVCMDQTMIDITEHTMTDGTTKSERQQVYTVNQGDEVVLIGQQGNIELTASDIAAQLGTNNYDVVSRILSRVPRIYL